MMTTTNNNNRKHRKKRNTGLLYEFLIRYISNALVENNDKNIKKAVKIFKKFFKKDKELYKEFRLFNSLYKTATEKESVASSILSEAKRYSNSFDLEKLDREKSLLIREINHNLNDEDFFSRRVPDYKTHATIQNLFNEWRSNSMDFSKVAEYEQFLTEWLMTPREDKYDLEKLKDNNIDALVLRLMSEKVNDKYSKLLNEEQKEIIKNYAFSIENDENGKLRESLVKIKEEILSNIKEYVNNDKEKNQYILEKLNKTEEMILNENLEVVDDEVITRFLKYSQLKQELIVEEKN